MKAIIAALMLASPAVAQEELSCGTREDQLAAFANRFGEHVVAMGVHLDGRLFETLADYNDGSWSVLVTIPDGPTCLVAGGNGFQGVVEKPGSPT